MNTSSDELLASYVASESEAERPLGEILQFLLNAGCSDEQILPAIHQISPNFGRPELAQFKIKHSL